PGTPLANWLRTKALMESVNPRIFESTLEQRVPSLRGLLNGLVGPIADPAVDTAAAGYTRAQWRSMTAAERMTALDQQAARAEAVAQGMAEQAQQLRDRADRTERQAGSLTSAMPGQRVRAALPRGPREPGRRPWVSWQPEVDRAAAGNAPPGVRQALLQQADALREAAVERDIHAAQWRHEARVIRSYADVHRVIAARNAPVPGAAARAAFEHLPTDVAALVEAAGLPGAALDRLNAIGHMDGHAAPAQALAALAAEHSLGWDKPTRRTVLAGLREAAGGPRTPAAPERTTPPGAPARDPGSAEGASATGPARG
uniref:hypothetical protein n=1 Tax=Pseudonocardia lacus TaxID=2835865 RepID=UPI001BDD9350